MKPLLLAVMASSLIACTTTDPLDVVMLDDDSIDSPFISTELAAVTRVTETTIDDLPVPVDAVTMPQIPIKQQFAIHQGTLRENARRFIEANGWTIAGHDYWQADNFAIDTGYPLTYTGIDDGLAALLANCPVKAQLIEINQTVVFVKRRHHREGP